MAIFLGAKGGDILALRATTELVNTLKAKLGEKMAYLLADEELELLRGVQEMLGEELAFEDGYVAEFTGALSELERAADAATLSDLHHRFHRLAADYFKRRGSVVALHSLCNSYQDGLVRKALLLAEQVLALDGMGRPPVPYCWLAAGSAGRLEQTFCIDPSYVLIYGDTPDDAGYFEKFVYQVLAFLERIGLVKNGGTATVMKSLWHGSRTEWRSEIVAAPVAEERERLDELMRRADLRLIYGAEALAEEMIGIVWGMLDFHQGKLRETSKSMAMTSRIRDTVSFPLPALRELGKGIPEMPAGLDFFRRLRVERRGRHRGEFDLEQFALAPLVTNVRMLASSCALHETSTINRIKGLQDRGHLSVELTDRLLRAYHDFTCLKVAQQLKTGCENEHTCFINPKDLTENEEQRLRNGLDTVSGLAKIAYLFYTEQE